jgi:hypothetical protein
MQGSDSAFAGRVGVVWSSDTVPTIAAPEAVLRVAPVMVVVPLGLCHPHGEQVQEGPGGPRLVDCVALVGHLADLKPPVGLQGGRGSRSARDAYRDSQDEELMLLRQDYMDHVYLTSSLCVLQGW